MDLIFSTDQINTCPMKEGEFYDVFTPRCGWINAFCYHNKFYDGHNDFALEPSPTHWAPDGIPSPIGYITPDKIKVRFNLNKLPEGNMDMTLISDENEEK